MRDGPDISRVAAMMGDPARANMLMALMSGMALTSNELAREASVSASTASTHLSQLESCGLVNGRRQGRFKYFALAGADVAHVIEALVAVASQAGHLRMRPGPKDDKMRRARTCYDHLAGHLAVAMFEHWVAIGVLKWRDEAVFLKVGRSCSVSGSTRHRLSASAARFAGRVSTGASARTISAEASVPPCSRCCWARDGDGAKPAIAAFA